MGALTAVGASASKLFLNENGGLSDQTIALLGSTPLVAVVGSAWEDMNSDGELDLVLVRHGDQPLIYFNNGNGGFDDGAGGSGPLAFGPSHGFSSMAVFDYNNDGYSDFMGLSNSSTRAPQLFHNVTGIGRHGFVLLPENIGLDDLGYVHGAIATDFGGVNQELDGLSDLYMGRPTASAAFYYKGEPNSASQSDDVFSVVRLTTQAGVLNKSLVGAIVKVQSGDITQAKIVDGGSLRGSQSYSDLSFGFGDYSGSITAEIKWPNGVLQQGVFLTPDAVNEIPYPTVLVLDSSVRGDYVVKASGLVDWVFSWEVNNVGLSSYDAVHFNTGNIPHGCQPQYPTITESTPGATLTPPVEQPGGGFKIVMTWEDRPCVPGCNIPFTVESGAPGQVDTSLETIFRVKICPAF